ncbi:MAG: amino acid permease [Candidatus Omnitrophica bacterium]|nr:amino acid permease [Candidatus Omnitrophota bacterium]
MPHKLTRQLRFWDSVAINIGIVIGVGIFRVPAEIAKLIDHPVLIIAAWVLGGLVSLMGVLCYAELSSCFPETGGTYVYLKEAFGKTVGFLFGWTEFLVLRAGSLAGIAYVLAAYLKNFVDLGPETEKVIAITSIAFFTGLNIAGLHYGTRVQNALSILKVATLAVMTALIFTFGKNLSAPTFSAGNMQISYAFIPALIPVLWAYGGWNESTFMSGEFTDTRKELPRSLITSIAVITLLYVLINMAYLKVMPPAEMKESQSIAADIFNRMFGSMGNKIMSCAVMISACGALNSYVMTGARIPFAVAQDVRRLSWMGEVHQNYGTPAKAFIVNAVWASVLILWGNFEELLFFTGFAKWFFFILAGASVFVLRKKLADSHKGFKMIGYPWVPIIFTFVSLALFITTIVHTARAALFGAAILLLGIPVYYVISRQKQS